MIEEIKEAIINGYWNASGIGEEAGAWEVIEEVNKVFEKYNIERKLSEDIIGDKVAYLEYNSKESAFVNNYQVSKIEVYEHKNHDRLYVLLMDGQYYLLARV